ncbi:uncharacterized protein LOC113305621 [Papaver somniferum]|uniref:uncharacterized protein LOC113305621 n=1 Tax=Papaver somniferum TaxID=3469 RepID=UPI000E703373|nr:uncharacterized protein LOC113305621 [Papaver somniferum]
MIRDAARMSRRCEECQRFSKRIHAPATKLNSVDSPCPFSKWGIDIVVPLIKGSGKRRFLIVAMDYFSKWVEAKALARIRDLDVFTFIFQNIICRFSIPAEIVSDNGKQLQGKNIDMLFDTFKIRKNKSTPKAMAKQKPRTRSLPSYSKIIWTNTRDNGVSKCVMGIPNNPKVGHWRITIPPHLRSRSSHPNRDHHANHEDRSMGEEPHCGYDAGKAR